MVINRARSGTYSPISDYGVVGDCRSAALISNAGSIDWWCPDRFDTPSVFAALLDRRHGGRFRIRPTGLNWSAEQRYLPATCVLETVFTTLDGRVRLLDFAPLPSGGPEVVDPEDRGLIRVIEGLSGAVTLEVGFDPRFGYGEQVPDLHDLPDGVLAQSGNAWARLWTSDPLGFEAGHARVTVRAGQQIGLTCRAGSVDEPERGSDPWVALDETVTYWSRWCARNVYAGPYHANVERSLLTLKLLAYAPTGAIVACVTTSLPRWIPGERTWDMRWAWLRDVARSASAFARAGFQAEAEAAVAWMAGALGSDGAGLPPARDVLGAPVPPERELGWLEGYEACRPVRVGNTAASIFQLDVAGELALAAESVGGASGRRLADLLPERLLRCWREPDLGAWALRAPPHEYVQGRALAVSALDVSAEFNPETDADRSEARRQIAAWVAEWGHDSGSGALPMLPGGIGVDAASLRLAAFRAQAFGERLPPTVEAVVTRLSAQGFVLPYAPDPTDFSTPRGASVPASFWLVEALCAVGRMQEAVEGFELLRAHSGSPGLLSEDADPYTGRALGNYPCAAAHAALVEAAFALDES